jgi:hypothetical protein
MLFAVHEYREVYLTSFLWKSTAGMPNAVSELDDAAFAE